MRRPQSNKCRLYRRWYRCAEEKGAISGTVYQTPTQHLVYFEPRAVLPFNPPIGTHLPIKILHPDTMCGMGSVPSRQLFNSSFNTLKRYARHLRCFFNHNQQ